jgi:adenylate kinase
MSQSTKMQDGVAGRVIRGTDCPGTIVRPPRTKKQKLMRPEPGADRGKRVAVVLMGPPGSGKTTLGRALAEHMPISLIEVGNLLKREVQRGTRLGRTIKPFTSAGKLVPLAYVTEIVSQALQKARENVVLFDGIPRSTTQIAPVLKMLSQHGLDLCAVIVLTLDFQTALDRLGGRRICNRCGRIYNVATRSSASSNICERCGGELIPRHDDQWKVVLARFRRFERETVPVIKFFKKKFGKLTWEQSATKPLKQRIDRIRRRLQKDIRHGCRRLE